MTRPATWYVVTYTFVLPLEKCRFFVAQSFGLSAALSCNSKIVVGYAASLSVMREGKLVIMITVLISVAVKSEVHYVSLFMYDIVITNLNEVREHHCATFACTQVKRLLQNISGEAKAGKLLAIMGPSGSGKTTLLNVLAGQLSASPRLRLTGSLTINGRPMATSKHRSSLPSVMINIKYCVF